MTACGVRILLLVVVVVLVVVWRRLCRRHATARIHCVVARYGESVGWLSRPEFRDAVDWFFVYNKGSPLTDAERAGLPARCTVHEGVRNVGRCDHTFLYHILRHYDRLLGADADVVTVFASGQADDPVKGPIIRRTLRRALATGDTVLRGQWSAAPVAEVHAGFYRNDWHSTNPENRHGEGDRTDLQPASVRPFGAWFATFWPNAPDVHVTCWKSIFAVHARHITQHPRAYYRRLCAELDTHPNPEAGHYMERSWAAVFSPHPRACVVRE